MLHNLSIANTSVATRCFWQFSQIYTIFPQNIDTECVAVWMVQGQPLYIVSSLIQSFLFLDSTIIMS